MAHVPAGGRHRAGGAMGGLKAEGRSASRHVLMRHLSRADTGARWDRRPIRIFGRMTSVRGEGHRVNRTDERVRCPSGAGRWR